MRSRLQLSLALFLLVLTPIVVRGAEKFRFIHLSDTHFSDQDNAGSHAETNALLYNEISTLESEPAFTITTGDIV